MFKCIDGSLKVTLAHSLIGPMLHTKSQGNRPSGSGEEYFKVFSMYVRGGHLVHVTTIICINV